MLADAPLAHLLHRRPRTLSLPTGHAPIASGGSNSCRVGYLPPTGSTCPFHGARFLRVSYYSTRQTRGSVALRRAASITAITLRASAGAAGNGASSKIGPAT